MRPRSLPVRLRHEAVGATVATGPDRRQGPTDPQRSASPTVSSWQAPPAPAQYGYRSQPDAETSESDRGEARVRSAQAFGCSGTSGLGRPPQKNAAASGGSGPERDLPCRQAGAWPDKRPVPAPAGRALARGRRRTPPTLNAQGPAPAGRTGGDSRRARSALSVGLPQGGTDGRRRALRRPSVRSELLGLPGKGPASRKATPVSTPALATSSRRAEGATVLSGRWGCHASALHPGPSALSPGASLGELCRPPLRYGRGPGFARRP
ncbi:hypothetical protein ACVWZX_000840 [Deinococcus sp. UYEF24]